MHPPRDGTIPALRAVDAPEIRSVIGLLRDAAGRHGGARAVSDERETITYGDLAARTEAWRIALADAGLGHGDRVALVLPNGARFVEAFLGMLAGGAAALPLSPAAPNAEIARTIVSGGIDGIVAPAWRSEALPTHVAHVAPDGGTPRILRRAARSHAPREPRPHDDAVLSYSFTTSPAVLTSRTHENLWWEAAQFCDATRLDDSDVILGVIPLCHAYGLGTALLAALRSGAHLVVRSRFLRRHVLDLLVAARVSVFPAVPFMLRMMTTTDRRRTWDLARLRFCLSAGAPLPRATFDAFTDRFRVPPRQLYGLSAAGAVTLDLAPDALVDPASCGVPLGRTEVAIRDAGADARPGTVGEVVVRSPAAKGGPSAPLRTGDLGFVTPGGALSIVGRTSRFINVASNKVDPHEVAAILRTHPAVAAATVVAADAAHAEQSVAAYVVLREAATADELRLHCASALASYKVPRFIRVRDALPAAAHVSVGPEALDPEPPAIVAVARERP